MAIFFFFFFSFVVYILISKPKAETAEPERRAYRKIENSKIGEIPNVNYRVKKKKQYRETVMFTCCN